MKGSTATTLFFALFGLLLLGIGFVINAGNNLVTNPSTQAATNETFNNVVVPLYAVAAISFVVAFVMLWFSLDSLQPMEHEVFRPGSDERAHRRQ
jgi:heme/copper-type cytochrome/quinol oxidase subunit 2